MSRTPRTLIIRILAITGAALLVAPLALGQTVPPAPAGGEDMTYPPIVVTGHEAELFRMAVPTPIGPRSLPLNDLRQVAARDLDYSSLYQLLDPDIYRPDPTDGLGIDAAPWRAIGAQGVMKMRITDLGGGRARLEMAYYEMLSPSTPAGQYQEEGQATNLRYMVHRAANEVVRANTRGEPGAFDTRLTFGRREGAGRKHVFSMDYDGNAIQRITSGRGVNLLPTFGPGGIWYSILTPLGMSITRQGASRPQIAGHYLNMGVTFHGDRMAFASSRDGNTEVYTARADGSDIRRLTNSGAIDVSPTFSADGSTIAFVSDRSGTPQIYTVPAAGGTPRRVTWRGSYNQTPAFCPSPRHPNWLAFTGRDGGTFDIFRLNIQSGEIIRVTQGQGDNRDPAWSPDCRIVAFARRARRNRSGVWISSPSGFNQNQVVRGEVETVRWSGRPRR
ncbi:MAG: PD40 domain-containing protein [Deltaproteobacteria bacterium]|nr:PD40 domain-containing protein [Deltaproteobacteria bacterium]